MHIENENLCDMG